MKRVAAGPTGPDQALNLEVWNGASARCWLRIFVCLAERQCLCDLFAFVFFKTLRCVKLNV